VIFFEEPSQDNSISFNPKPEFFSWDDSPGFVLEDKHLLIFPCLWRLKDFGGTTLNPQNSRSRGQQLATPPSIWSLIACESSSTPLCHPTEPKFKFNPKSA